MESESRATSSAPGGVTRRDVIGATVGLVVAGVGAPRTGEASPGDRGQVGASGAANGLEFLGEIAQVGEALTAYGYFTAVSGLDLDQLYFAGGDRSEATARFTFFGTAQLTSIQRRGDLFVAHAPGHLEIFLRDAPGATFEAPASFAEGQRIAADEATLENILNVTAPNTAVTTVFGDLRRTEVSSFTLDGIRYRLGRVGLRSRLVAPGKGIRTDPDTPRAILIVGGNTTNPD